jgi:hypothetical protein
LHHIRLSTAKRSKPSGRRPSNLLPIRSSHALNEAFLPHFGLDTLRNLPDFRALEDARLLSKEKLLAGDIAAGLASDEGDEAEEQSLDTVMDGVR